MMGLPVVALAKLKLILLSSRSTATPVLSFLVAPFLIKLSFGYYRLVRGTYSDLVLAVRLFVFQLGQIVARTDRADRAVSGEGGSRWERAFRLVCRRISNATRPRGPAIDVEDSLHTLSMLAVLAL